VSENWVTVDAVLSAIKTYSEIKNNEKTMAMVRIISHAAAWANIEKDEIASLTAELASNGTPNEILSEEYKKKFTTVYYYRATALEILLEFEKLNDFRANISDELGLAKDVTLKLSGRKYPGWKKALKTIIEIAQDK